MSSRHGRKDRKEDKSVASELLGPSRGGRAPVSPRRSSGPRTKPAHVEFLSDPKGVPPYDASQQGGVPETPAAEADSGRWQGGPGRAGRPPGEGRARPPTGAEEGFPPNLNSVATALEAFGLRRATSRLYCAALSVGPAPPLEIILSAQVRRATGYRALERLRKMELVVPVEARPLRVEAAPLSRLLDRSASALEDELDLHREIREVATETLARPDPGPGSRAAVLFGSARTGAVLRSSLAEAQDELLVIPVLRGLPAEARAALLQGIEDALERDVHVRLLLPYEPTYLRLLSSLHRAESPSTHLLTRLCEPPFFHLYVIDSTKAVRFFVRTTPSDRPSGTLGLASDRRSFVQAQEQRFRSLWSEAPALELPSTYGEDPSDAP
jgi:sugar-specific transcriptional regulator TrmB